MSILKTILAIGILSGPCLAVLIAVFVVLAFTTPLFAEGSKVGDPKPTRDVEAKSMGDLVSWQAQNNDSGPGRSGWRHNWANDQAGDDPFGQWLQEWKIAKGFKDE